MYRKGIAISLFLPSSRAEAAGKQEGRRCVWALAPDPAIAYPGQGAPSYCAPKAHPRCAPPRDAYPESTPAKDKRGRNISPRVCVPIKNEQNAVILYIAIYSCSVGEYINSA